MAVVLGIDLGTFCGWAVSSEGRLSSGTWPLKPGKRSCDKTRELVLFRRLEGLRKEHGVPDLVAYEEVVAHGRGDEKVVSCPTCGNNHSVRIQATNVIAAQVYGALRGVLRMWCDFHSVRIEGVAVGTLKLFAAGNGRASKDDMVAYANLQWRDQNIQTHDQADALHVLDWALTEVLGRRGKAVVDRRSSPRPQPPPPLPQPIPELEF